MNTDTQINFKKETTNNRVVLKTQGIFKKNTDTHYTQYSSSIKNTRNH